MALKRKVRKPLRPADSRANIEAGLVGSNIEAGLGSNIEAGSVDAGSISRAKIQAPRTRRGYLTYDVALCLSDFCWNLFHNSKIGVV